MTNQIKTQLNSNSLIRIFQGELRTSYDIKDWKAVIVDGEKIKADTWYCLKDGELKEVESEE